MRLRNNIKLEYLIVLFFAGIIYVFTCAPAILWQDSGRFVYRILHNDLEGKLGLALAHPLYIMIGIAVKYIPFGDLAHRINLISAVFGAVTIANLYLLMRLWLGRSLPGIIAAITLAVSWTFWLHTAIAECYTLFAAQLLGELILLLQYVRTRRVGYLYLLGLLNGLAISNHLWGLLGLACYAVLCIFLLIRKQISLKHLVIVILLWIIGAGPYEYLIIKNIILTGDFWGTLTSAIYGGAWQGSVLNTSITLKMVAENIIFILYNFPTPNFLLLFLGLGILWKASPCRSFANIIFTLLILYFVFAFRYTVPDRHVFFLPFYCITAAIMGLGAEAFLCRYNRRLLVFLLFVFAMLPIPVYCVAPGLARKYYKPLAQRIQRPYRDEYKYWLQPWKPGYRGAERFANEVLESVEENAIIYADTTTAHSLLYIQQVHGKRKDVKIVSGSDKSENAPILSEETVSDLANNSALYIVSPLKGYCPRFLLDSCDFVRVGFIYKAELKSN